MSKFVVATAKDYAKQRDEQISPTLKTQTDQDLRSHALDTQCMRQLICLLLDLPITQATLLLNKGDGLRIAGRLPRE